MKKQRISWRPQAEHFISLSNNLERALNAREITIKQLEIERQSAVRGMAESEKRAAKAEEKLIDSTYQTDRVREDLQQTRKRFRRRILDLEMQVARLQGYVDRTRETERGASGPSSEKDDTLVPFIAGAESREAEGCNPPGGITYNCEPKHWLDL